MTVHGPATDRPLALLVDDDVTLRLLACEALEHGGFAVQEAENGAHALALFDRLHPDIVVMDVMMPEMDGFEACKALRQRPGGSDVPVLIMTGLDDLESISRAYDAGATDFVTKPINGLLLSHRVRYMLRASRAVDALRTSEARLAQAQRIAQMGHWLWDLEKESLEGSEEIYRILGLASEDFGGTYEAYLQAVHPMDRQVVTDAIQAALAANSVMSFDHRILRPDGTERIVHKRAEIVRDAAGRAIRMIGTVQDITERRRAEEQIHYLANYDSLTNLPNRRLFQDRLTQSLAVGSRRGQIGAILLLNLDRFKRINDTFGHTEGDHVLQQVSERLSHCVRRSDTVSRQNREDLSPTVSRLGGDEFTIMLTPISSGDAPAKVASRILTSLSHPLTVGAQEIVLSASIGIALYPADGQDVASLLKNADTAMYQAKEKGRNRYQFYSEAMNAKALERLTLESSLRKAIERGQLEVHYQPQVCIQTGEFVGTEALLRWRHPDFGLISPGEFIPLAEETGLIIPIGEWVLRTACAQQKAWEDAGLPRVHVAVNLSSLQFTDGRLIETIDQVLRETGLDPLRLELELTESMIMQDAEGAIATLRQLNKMGLRLAIDDFGTGYSSLSYLRRFPIQTLKIDRSFVMDLTVDSDTDAITGAIIALAHSLNLRVLAEGVETSRQLSFLKVHGCDEVQGYLIGRPVPADHMTHLLKTAPSLMTVLNLS